MKWIAGLATAASLANGFAQALGFLKPGATGGAARVLLIAGALGFFTWINVIGVRWGARTAAGLAVTKLPPLLLLVAVGIVTIDPGSVIARSAPSTQGLGQATLLILFAYAGFENCVAVAGECRNPRRDLPFALISMICGVTVLYFLIQLVALGSLPDLAARAGGSPLADAAVRLMGGWAGSLLTAGAVVSILGALGGSILNVPRYLFAMAQDGFGPRLLAGVHPRWRTPHAAIATHAGAGVRPCADRHVRPARAALGGCAARAVHGNRGGGAGSQAEAPANGIDDRVTRRAGDPDRRAGPLPRLPGRRRHRGIWSLARYAFVVGAGVYALRRRATEPAITAAG